jgi:hypothetical protein
LIFYDLYPFVDIGTDDTPTAAEAGEVEVCLNGSLGLRTGVNENDEASATAQGFDPESASSSEKVKDRNVGERKPADEDIEYGFPNLVSRGA